MGLLAGLDALVVALALLFAMLAATYVIRPLLVNVLKDAPIVGSWLASNVDSGLASFQRAITAPANASLYVVSSTLDWLATQGRALTSGLTDLLNAAFWTSWTLATVTVPDAVDKARRQAEQDLAVARTDLGNDLAVARVQIGQDLAVALTGIETEMAVVRTDLNAEVTAAESIALQEIRKAEQVTGQLFQQAEYDAGQLVAASEIKLADLVSRAREDLGAAVGAVEHDLQLLAAAERVALADSTSVLGEDIKAAEARGQAALSGLEDQVKAEIEKVLASGPWSGLVALYEGGEEALKRNVLSLALPAAKAIREQLANVDELRAKYGPEIAKAGEALRP